MDRVEAVLRLARYDRERLSPDARAEILDNWWAIDDTDPSYCGLSDELKNLLATCAQPTHPSDSVFDELIEYAIARSYTGVLNSYLESKLAAIGIASQVSGQFQRLELCPCCEFHSLSRLGEYEICPVCFWEDDGTKQSTAYSSANHLTLAEARLSFSQIGAVFLEMKGCVLKDGTERYPSVERP
jgi:hypothetical protein